jgi:hypothetical protein
VEHINEAVQRVLDRLIFIRNLEDRGIVSEESLLFFTNAKEGIYPHLIPLFRRLDNEYNGQIFKEHFSEKISIDDPVIKGIIKQLYPPHSPYAFDTIEPEILGRIYERFLGSKIRLAGINYQLVNVGLTDKGNSNLSGRLLYEGTKENENDVEYWKGVDINEYFITQITNRFVRTNTVKPEAQTDIRYILSIMNSKYFRWLYMQNVKEEGHVFPQIKFAKLVKFSIPSLDISQKPDKAKHDALVSLADKMLDLKQKEAAKKSERLKAVITRQINAVNNEIDTAVCELYGLTTDEIKAVEGKQQGILGVP